MYHSALPMLLRIFLVVLALIACVLLFAATKPSTFHIERSITIIAPPAKIFALIDDFHNWPQWASQDRDDPAMRRTYSGANAGTGAVCDWTGTKGSTGDGRMIITQDAANSKVSVEADWRKPFPVRNTNEFTLAPAGQATQLTWSITGTNLYMMKVMEVFVGVNGLMGSHLDTGLDNLKKVAEQ